MPWKAFSHQISKRRPRGRRRWRLFLTLSGGLLLSALAVVAPQTGAQPPPPNLLPADQSDDDGIETLTRGPIHEAFANPADPNPTPSPVVNRPPPQDVPEEPPEYMPEDSIWISGYWFWDEERNDFVWVTGVARTPPPDSRYVEGYWTEVEGGWQRIPGFWVSTKVTELQYVEPPPESLENGPSSPAPADNYFWVPGNWVYYDTGYRWQAGRWAAYQPNWVWCPARYVWTPAGCVYLAGYWDYPLTVRGQIFAPVYFRNVVYTRPGWYYRPWCVIPTSNLFVHLWVRPTYCHYYFGNYYGQQYNNWGLVAWVNFPAQRYSYDPFYSYCRVHYQRRGVDFVGRVNDWHHYYAEHTEARPPNTWREQQLASRGSTAVALETQLVARNVVDIAKRNDAPVKLTRVDEKTRQAQREQSEKQKEVKATRKKVEGQVAVTTRLPTTDATAEATAKAATVKGAKEAPVVQPADDATKIRREISKAGKTIGPKLTLPKADTAPVARTASKGKTAVSTMNATVQSDVPPPFSRGEKVSSAIDDLGQRRDLGEGAPQRGQQVKKARQPDLDSSKTLPDTNPTRDSKSDLSKARAGQPTTRGKTIAPTPKGGEKKGTTATSGEPRRTRRIDVPEVEGAPGTKGAAPDAEKAAPRVDVPKVTPDRAPKVEIPRTNLSPPPKIDTTPKGATTGPTDTESPEKKGRAKGQNKDKDKEEPKP
jgi:hypothetical protein